MISRELRIFLVVGMLTVLLDYSTYHGLLSIEAMPVRLAKGAGFLAGTIFSYVANRLWTFGTHRPQEGSLIRFATLYALTLGANVMINDAALYLLSSFPAAKQIAFVIATGVSAVLNFVGMKWFVFKTRPASLDHA
jgi:putative flippase GtrA